MKIAFLRTMFWFGGKTGGSVSHICGFANGNNELKNELFFISTDKLAEVDESKNPVHVLAPSVLFKKLPFFGEILFNPLFVARAKRLIRAEKPDVIYQRHSGFSTAGVKLSKHFHLPLILEFNSSETWKIKNWSLTQNWIIKIALKFVATLMNSFENYSLQNADLIIVVSEALKESLVHEGIEDKKILVNPNGVDLQKINPIPSCNKFVKAGVANIGFVGTFGPWHGTEILCKAVEKVAEKNSKVHFVLIGDGSGKKTCENIIKNAKMQKFVTFTGQVAHSQAIGTLKACDILASPHIPNPDGSKFFGSPTKLFEYMALDKGIVASDLDQIGEILKEYNAALLVKPGHVDDLAKGILTLIDDKKMCNFFAQNAYKAVAQNFTWKDNARRALEALKNIK